MSRGSNIYNTVNSMMNQVNNALAQLAQSGGGSLPDGTEGQVLTITEGDPQFINPSYLAFSNGINVNTSAAPINLGTDNTDYAINIGTGYDIVGRSITFGNMNSTAGGIYMNNPLSCSQGASIYGKITNIATDNATYSLNLGTVGARNITLSNNSANFHINSTVLFNNGNLFPSLSTTATLTTTQTLGSVILVSAEANVTLTLPTVVALIAALNNNVLVGDFFTLRVVNGSTANTCNIIAGDGNTVISNVVTIAANSQYTYTIQFNVVSGTPSITVY